jgi:hypothetical protein
MRLSNSMFAGFSAMLMIGIGSLLGLAFFTSAVAAVMSVNTPALIQQFATVNTDAGSVFAITACIFLALRLPTRTRTSHRRLSSQLIPSKSIDFSIVVFPILTSFLISIKETALLILPTVCLLFTFIRENQRTVSKHQQRTHIFKLSRPIILQSVLLFICSFGLVGFFRWSQPHLRGVGGEDWQSIAFSGDGSLNLSKLLVPFGELFASSSQLVWAPLADSIGRNISLILSLVFISAITLGFIDPALIQTSKPEQNSIFRRTLQIGISTIPFMAVALGFLSWIQADFVISQPRYYLPISTAICACVLMIIFAVLKPRTVMFIFAFFVTLLTSSFIVS